MHTVRLLPFDSDTGAGNMARDEALLLSAADHGVATLRFYTWNEPTLSLGYFQPSGERLFLPPPLRGRSASEASRVGGESMSWVRRSTGGAAIVHDPPHEITYSLALPPGSDWQPSGELWICRMHYVIRDVLKSWGATASVVVCGEEQKHGPVLCFLHHTPGDLVIEPLGYETPSPGSELRSRSDLSPARGGEVLGGRLTGEADERGSGVTPHLSPASGGEVAGCRTATPAGEGVGAGVGDDRRSKIAGSAQRKWKGALLQHGSILLGRSPFASELPGIAELTGVSVNANKLAAAMTERFAAVTGWAVAPGEWTAEELHSAERIAAEKYTSAEWNEKR